jgi:hypothetical protein
VSAIDFAAVADLYHFDSLGAIIDSVHDAEIPLPQPISFLAAKFFASLGSGVLRKLADSSYYLSEYLFGKGLQLFDG